MVVTLVHVDWRALAVFRGTVIVATAAIAVYWLRRSPAADRHRLWALSLLLCLFLPPVSAFVAAGAGPSSLAVPEWLLVMWLVGAAGVVMRGLVGVTVATRISRDAAPVADDAWRCLLADVRRQIGVSRRVALRTTPDVTAPITLGWFRPVVLVPPEHVTWSPECRRAVLAHELAHVRRHDWPLQLIERLVCGLYWFFPPIQWAAARRRIEAERACDEIVIAHGVPRAAYARHLLAVLEASGRPLRGTTAFVRGAGEGEIGERVRAILRSPAPTRRGRWSMAAAGLLVAGGASILVSAPGPVCPLAMEAAGMPSRVEGVASPSPIASR
jgi:beta-lactamase regulating signal transducer with metallopeptidase domain